MPTVISFLVLLPKSSRVGLHPVARGPLIPGAINRRGKNWIAIAAPRPQPSLGRYGYFVMVRASERSWPCWVDEADGDVERVRGDDLCQSDIDLGLSVGGRVEKPDGHEVVAAIGPTYIARTARLKLRIMRDRGASTIAQVRASCDIHEMPGEAAALQVAAQLLAIGDISDELARIAQSRNECGTES